MTSALDRLDRDILRLIQEDCSLSAEDIAARCGGSASTISRRLKRFRDEGIVTRTVAVVDPRKAGRPLTVITGVRLDGEDSAGAKSFRDAVCAHPAVTQCYFVTGPADYVVILNVRDIEEYDAFVQKYLVANKYVHTTHTSVVIGTLKSGLAIPID